MLNSTLVLDYVKDNLGFPFMHLEWEDDKILDFIQKYTLREFSLYFPEVKTTSINPTLSSTKVPTKQNEYYIIEPEGREILNVSNIYFGLGNLMIHGHPPLGPMSMGEVQDWALQVHNAGLVKSFSNWNYTYEFKHPNIVRISPSPTNVSNIAVEYEVMQSSDFRGIRNDLHRIFLELALADIMVAIGRIRKRYGGGSMRTPFGEIPLDSEIYDEGKEKKRELIDLMKAGSLPNVTIEIG